MQGTATESLRSHLRARMDAPRYGRIGAAIAVALAATALGSPVCEAGTITKVKGDPHTDVEIIKVTFKAVHWAMQGGAKGQYGWDQVASVEYDDTPTEYLSAETHFEGGRYAEALADYQKAAKNDSRKVWVFQEAMWKSARCHMATGKMAEAVRVLTDLNTADPEHRYLLDAMLALGRASMQLGKADEAEKHFAKLVEVANANELKRYFYEGRVWKARCFLLAGKSEDAKREYQSVSDQARGQFAKIAAMAQLGEAEVLVTEKNHSSARDKLNNVIGKFEVSSQDDDELDLLARAYNALGETYYYQPTPDYAEAMRAFLKIVTLLDDQANEMPKALWHAAKCFHELRGEGKEWAQRSLELRNQLRNQYPSSAWAKKW